MSAFNNTLCDTPIGCVVEYDADTNAQVSTTYLFYDADSRVYCLRGRVGNKSPTYYSYNSYRTSPIFDYFKFVTLEAKNKFSYSLLNADHLPTRSEDITWDLLDSYQSQWISAWDEKKVHRGHLKRLLNIVKGLCYKA